MSHELSAPEREWAGARVLPAEINRYLDGGGDFIPDARLDALLADTAQPDRARVLEILEKSLAVQTLSVEETALLIRVRDPELVERMKETAIRVKKKVYDNRIVTFAPLYLGNRCVNRCVYCALRHDNEATRRKVLDFSQVRAEVEHLAGVIGHKRLIVVYGEHPDTDIGYMAESIRQIYSVSVKTRRGTGGIRRVNVNAAPMSVADLRVLKDVGLGTYQVFQETYSRRRYAQVHAAGTPKGDFRWRLYAMHRAMEAGIDDVGIGALYGLYDWRFELLGLVCHAHELEKRFGIGPHTVSFPRLDEAENTPFVRQTPYRVSDEDFKRIILITRLAVPYTGMILTARESPQMRREVLDLGCTQTDASTRVGVGAYTAGETKGEGKTQQFIIGDDRSLDEVVREFAQRGFITSFCTAGYRCGRTGDRIMELLRSGKEGKFCKLNAVITFREWLDDFASPETRAEGERLIAREIEEIRQVLPEFYPQLVKFHERTGRGERDLYF